MVEQEVVIDNLGNVVVVDPVARLVVVVSGGFDDGCNEGRRCDRVQVRVRWA